jgi:hypothetical protein
MSLCIVGTFKVLAESKYEAQARLNQELQKYEAAGTRYVFDWSVHF